MADALIVEQQGRVVTLTNNDAPDHGMSLDFMDELEAVVPRLGQDGRGGAS